jgi:CHAD domain-containing protein
MPIRNGDHAHRLLESEGRQLVALHGPVLEGDDATALEGMRLSLRRLRVGLLQFEPALELPGTLSAKRLAKSERRLALAWELDRLLDRLETVFLAQVPEREVRRLRTVLRQLKRERQLAHDHLAATLRSGGHLELIAQLQNWLRQPVFTPLGEQPLADWLREWDQGSEALPLHRGWWVAERGEDLDALRHLEEGVACARLRIENLPPCGHGGRHRWPRQLRRAEALLVELSDLELLRKAIDDQLRDGIERTVPQLEWLLEQHQLQCWRQWRELAEDLLAPAARRRRAIGGLACRQPPSGWGGIRRILLSMAARIG